MSHASMSLPTKPLPPLPLSPVAAPAKALSIPWTIWWMVAGITLTLLGGIWDFAWHMSIGRDSMWVPPHITVQIGGLLVDAACASAIFTATFGGSSTEHTASVTILGLRGPAGAFIALWGCLAILASEPFDNWWHSAYGLDVTMITPPHSLLFLGSLAAKVGAMAWIASLMSRSTGTLYQRLQWLFLFVGGMGVRQLAVVVAPYAEASDMHSAVCYLILGCFLPPVLVAAGWGSLHKWGCTLAAAVYTAFGVGSEWLLPLFAAQPKLGPVYHHVTHLVPMGFPLLLVVPAVFMDLFLQRLHAISSLAKAICLGSAFLLGLIAVQWPFANFLMSPAARNWLFGTAYFAYSDTAGFLYDPYRFDIRPNRVGAATLIFTIAFVTAATSSRVGLALGGWMRRVRR